MRKYILALLLLVSILISCGTKSSSSKKIRVGTMVNTVALPIAYALEKGMYSNEGIEIEILTFASGAPINEAFAAGEIDIAASGLASVFALAQGNAKWIGEVNTTGGMGIFVRQDSPIAKEVGKVAGYSNILGSAETVRGLQILGPLGTTAQFNAIGYAKKFGLGGNDIKMIHMDNGPAYQAFIAGEGDAIAASPPHSFQAREEGYVLAATFEDATDVVSMDGIYVGTKFLEERRDDVVKFIRATYKASEILSDYQTRYDFEKDWFERNGRVYDDKTLDNDINYKVYVTPAMMQEETYIFGDGMTGTAEFFYEDNKISEDTLPNVQKSYDVSVIKDALGIDVKVDQ
ncbi:hypothetical protein BFL38_10745 [Brachyspira hampsonii]|uniref:ABC transporter substrate-binding protein n=1 Tax=Brachyspira hampsonii TaxID=1287055 RepID=A0A1E5NIN3_9SPIR|nr:ABC transporter substrate-binding protein [Brachyspira hampsonii]OEJ15927.1 hypothetical protein BFL38_10745 [Brachyspira hampsonii]